MNYKIRWTANAYSDFSQTVVFIKERWSKKSAEDFINRVDTVLNILAIFPQLGKIIYPPKQIRAIVISKQTTLVYRIKSDNIIIINLFDNRQDPEKLRVNEKISAYQAKISNM